MAHLGVRCCENPVVPGVVAARMPSESINSGNGLRRIGASTGALNLRICGTIPLTEVGGNPAQAICHEKAFERRLAKTLGNALM